MDKHGFPKDYWFDIILGHEPGRLYIPHLMKHKPSMKHNNMDIDSLTDSMHQLQLPKKISFGKKKTSTWTMHQVQKARTSLVPK
jgi:hypothetical protein